MSHGMRRDILRPSDMGRYFQVPLPRFVDWDLNQKKPRDSSELVYQSYPVREEVIKRFKQIYEAFNGVQVDEISSTVGAWELERSEMKLREFTSERLRNIAQHETERLGRAVVYWFPLVEEDHPLHGSNQKVLVQRLVSIPLLTSWPEV